LDVALLTTQRNRDRVEKMTERRQREEMQAR